MTFFNIQDPNKRDEIVREMNERRKRMYQDSISDVSGVSLQMSGASTLDSRNPASLDSRNPASLTGNNMINTSLKESEGGSIQNSYIPEMQKLMNVGEVASHYLKMYTSNNISNKN